LIGGMPEAVQHFLDDGDLDAIFDIQDSIYQTYRDDFSKYAHGQALIRLQKIIDYMGQGTGRKVKYVNIDRESQSREVKQAVDLILKAGLVLQAVHTHGDGVPLGAQSDPKVSKLYSLDIGLYNRICNLRRLSEHEMRDTRFINEGMIAEQFIAQYLYFRETPKRKPDLHYWLREGSARNAEVDFLIQVGQKVVPVEIKSGKSGTLKSLFQFALEKRCQVACRFDLNLPSVQSVEQNLNGEVVALNLLSLPLYMCHEMERLING
jgi:predicted AAA+ superfamily ATPase